MEKMKKMMVEAKKKVAEMSLFLSAEFAKLMQAMALSVTKAFKKAPEMVIYKGSEDTIAYTDSKAIHVNFAHSLIQTHYGRKATMWEKVNAIKALVMHEAAHIAKTDFHLMEQMVETMSKEKKLWPLCNYVDAVPNAEELEDYCSRDFGGIILKTYHGFENILEDSYINHWLRTLGRKWSELFAWYLQKEGDYSPTFEELAGHYKEEKEKYRFAEAVLLEYAKYGVIKMDDPKNRRHEIIEHLRDIEDDVDEILDDDDPFYRVCHCQKIFCHYWPYLKAMIDDIAENGEPSGSGTGMPMPISAPAPTGNGGATIASPMRQSTDEEVEQMMSSSSENGEGNDESESDSEGESSGGKENGEEEPDDGVSKAISGGKEETEEEDKGEGGSSDPGSNTDTNIQKLLDDMAQQEVNEKMDAESSQKLGEISKGVNGAYPGERLVCHPRRITADTDNRRMYADVAKVTEPVTKAMAKYFLQKFRDGMEGDIRTGLYSGTGIDWNAEARDDLATFYKEDDPTESKPLAVCYLGDESGSMYGEKASMNRLTAITVYNFCDMLDLPVGVYGHTSGNGADCDFRIYADFRKDPNDRYRMMNIEANAGNKDGYALRLASERLLAQDAENKVLIITSDGLPSDYRSRDEGIKDIQSCIKKYSRKGIHYIAAAMDADKEQIKQIYGASFLDISDLSKMPKKLVMMLAKELG